MLKIKAGALQFVLFMGAVIALLLLTFIGLSHAHTLFGKKSELLIQTVKQADLGLDYAMKTQMAANDTIALQMQLQDQIEVKGIKEFWGAFEKYTVVSTSKKNRFIKSVLVGKSIFDGIPALYLKDNQRPMIIVGDAQITGDAFLPEQGIRPGNIAGRSFYGTTLVHGGRRKSNTQLPKLSLGLRKHLENLSQNGPVNALQESLSLSNGANLENSFKEPTKIIYGDVIDLAGISLTGNILVKASQRIIVDASTKLQDIVLLAPKITIKDRVMGTFQAIAEEQIRVGKNCSLGYPSALVVSKNKWMKRSSGQILYSNIFLDSNTTLKGVVVFLGPSEERRFSPQIKISDTAKIWGEIYCEQNLELKGEVIGNVTTNAFMALERGSIYQNHLFNGKINGDLLTGAYAGLLLDGQNRKKAICKWLY